MLLFVLSPHSARRQVLERVGKIVLQHFQRPQATMSNVRRLPISRSGVLFPLLCSHARFCAATDSGFASPVQTQWLAKAQAPQIAEITLLVSILECKAALLLANSFADRQFCAAELAPVCVRTCSAALRISRVLHR